MNTVHLMSPALIFYIKQNFVVDLICYFKFQNTHGIITGLEKKTKKNLSFCLCHMWGPPPLTVSEPHPLSTTVCIGLFWSFFRCHYVVRALYFYFLFPTKALFPAPLSRSGLRRLVSRTRLTLLFEKSWLVPNQNNSM